MKIFKTLLLIPFLFLAVVVFGQDTHTINVYFLYGSKPAHHHKKDELKLFGGLHGGHVSIGIDTVVNGFNYNNDFHIFPRKRNINAKFVSEGITSFKQDSISRKYTTFQITLADSQYYKLKTIYKNYLAKTPYDYAFFGMRCAASTYEILSQLGILKIKSKCCNIFSNFYPKLLRRKMFKLAKKYNYKITKQAGRASRKWEQD